MNASNSIIQTHPRYRQLDSLRGLAALCVFFSHYFIIFKFSGNWVYALRASPAGILLNGRGAVMFFFVLSGFVLSLPFVNSERPLSLTEFYTKRIFRIYPAYLFAILFAILLKTFIYDKNDMQPFSEWISHFWAWDWNKGNYKEILKTFLLIGPRFNADLIDPVIWSLVAEMQMSFLLPFFIIIVSRSNALFNFLFFMIVLALIFNHPTGFLGIFYLGILTAKYKDYLIAKIETWNHYLLIAVILACLFAYNIGYEFFKPYGDKEHPFGYFWRDSLNAFSCCILIIIAISRKRISYILQNSFFTFLGDISYSFYLLHLPLLITMCSVFSSKFLFSNVYIFLAVIISAFILSYLSFTFIEKPFQKYAKRLTEKWHCLKTLNMR